MVAVTCLKSIEEKNQIIEFLKNNILPVSNYRQQNNKFMHKCEKFKYSFTKERLFYVKNNCYHEALAPEENIRRKEILDSVHFPSHFSKNLLIL